MNELMIKLIDEARKVQGHFVFNSDYDAGSVAAALITEDGNIYTGICLDFSCGIGFCAEHSAIAEMLKNRETVIKMIVAVDSQSILSPCGRCREMMMQLDKRNKDTKVIVSTDKYAKLEELLPFYNS